MILQEPTRKVEEIGLQGVSSFGIDAEDVSHVINALSDSVYSNKVYAVIREYSSNAQDAHVEANKPNLAIEITLPTNLEPVFKVRDYGNSLTEDEVRNVYARLGKSTKRGSNSFVGRLGFGSKSAFSYTSTFDVITYLNNIKTYFQAYVSEDFNKNKVFNIAKVHSEPTLENNGVEITIPVRREDIESFHDTAKWAFRYFNPTPVFFNGDTVSSDIEVISSRVPLFKGEDWAIFSRKNVNSSRIVMGNIAYPLNANIYNDYKPEERPYYELLRDSEVIIYAPIGSVRHTVSRESIDYKPDTTLWIKSKLQEISESIVKEYTKKSNEVTSLWDFLSFYNDVSTEINWLRSLIRINMVYKGKAHTDNFLRLNEANACGFTFKSYASYDFNGSRAGTGSILSSITPNSKSIIVVNDKVSASQIIARLRTVVKKFNESIIFINHTSLDATTITTKLDDFDGMKYVKLSDFEQTHKVKSGNVTSQEILQKHKSKVFEMILKSTDDYVQSSYWKTAEVDLENDKEVYVVIKGFVPTGLFNLEIKMKNVVELLNSISALDAKLPKRIIGIKEQEVKKLGKNMKPLVDFIQESVNNIFNKLKIKEFILDFNYINKNPRDFKYTDENTLPEGKFKDYIIQYKKIKKVKESPESIKEFDFLRLIKNVRNIKIPNIVESGISNSEKDWENIQKNYPLIDVIYKSTGYYQSSIPNEKLLEYFQMCESSFKNS